MRSPTSSSPFSTTDDASLLNNRAPAPFYGPAQGQALPPPPRGHARAWITIVDTIPHDGPDWPGRWKYKAHVLSHPQDLLLSPAPPYVQENVVAFNALEVGNTEASVWGNDIEPGGTCGSINAVVAAQESYYGYPLEAELRWTWFESGDPDDGYWAWWFSAPNMVDLNP